MDNRHISILAVDRAFQPDKWIDAATAINLLSRGLVTYSLGEVALTLYGGTNAKTGLQSKLEIGSILVIDTKNFLVTDFDFAPFDRASLFKRDRCTCAYCGKQFKPSELEIEHVIPQCQGGNSNWTNLVSSCSLCNRRKAGRTPEQAGMPLLYLPYKPSRYEWLILRNRNILQDQMEFLNQGLPKHSRML